MQQILENLILHDNWNIRDVLQMEKWVRQKKVRRSQKKKNRNTLLEDKWALPTSLERLNVWPTYES